VLVGAPAPHKNGHSTPVFSPCLLWPNGWMINMPLGTKVDLSPVHTVLDENQLYPRKGHSSPCAFFGPCLSWPNGRQSQLLLSTFSYKSSARCLPTIDKGRKWGLCPFLEELGPLSNTMSPETRPTSVPSGILIHLGVWPQETWTVNSGAVPLLGGARSPI